MRLHYLFTIILLLLAVVASAQTAPTPQCCTLTIAVHGMDSSVGNLGVLIFNNPKGWPEDRHAAYKDISVPAQQGTQILTVPDLPPGEYAVALIHDVNKNHKLDKNWLGMPKEQWGISNNPHATIKAPPISKAWFKLDGNKQIDINLQK